MAVLLTLAVLGAAGCHPNYPACESDEDCKREGVAGQEFCVNKLCQKCRNDKDCAEGTYCNKGRCDALAGYCKDDSACAPGETCLEHKCQGCVDDGQCGPGGKCRKGKCLRKGQCETESDCPEGQDCKNGTCVGGAPPQATQDAACKLVSVFFDYNESQLSTDAVAAIDANANCMRKVQRPAKLIGRSDPRGTEEYNMALSERRALSVKERLGRLGIADDKLRTLPKGELDATGKDEAGWAQDRRVDFEWM